VSQRWRRQSGLKMDESPNNYWVKWKCIDNTLVNGEQHLGNESVVQIQLALKTIKDGLPWKLCPNSEKHFTVLCW
jgi:hypothetical protein